MLATTRPMKTAGGVLALMAALVLSSAAPAEAILQLELTDGTTTVLIQDQDFVPTVGTDADLNGVDGVITYAAGFPGWTFFSVTGVGAPVVGTSLGPALSFNLTGQSSAASDLTVRLTRYDASGIFPDGFSGLSGNNGRDVWNGQTASTLDKAAYWGTSLFDVTTNPAFFSETGITGVFDEFYIGGPITTDGPTSLTLVWTIHAAGPGEFTTGNNTLTIPEPAMLGLFGVGLLSFAALARRRQRRGQTKT